ncbi:MAG: hypothetical protein LBJ58_08140 [Tannerellaceae bacterium]|jgi:hypothetical protein|nr:hypothetical protein [Tannerellaceae bacterium]
MNKKKKLLLQSIVLIAINASAQVGIGTRQPDVAAMLDVVSSDKGVLIPRVLLKSVDCDLDGTPGQPTGLLVYHKGNNVLSGGFYFWNGKEWKYLESATAVSPSITKLECPHAHLEPQSFKAGKSYIGQLTIPYTGGNGGKYSAGNEILSTGNTGLKIRLRAGRLEHGSGSLVYDVSGVPVADSPQGATFQVEFNKHKCSITVGEVQSATVTSIASVGPLEYTNDNARSGYGRVVTSPDKKFSVRVFIINGGTLDKADIQIRSNAGIDTIMWNGHVSWQGGTKGTGGNKFALPLPNVWYGNKGDNGDEPDTGNNAAWGDEDVYYAAPEQRRYIWTSTNTTDKTVYILTFMMGAPSPNITANNVNASKSKAFLRIEQVSAD